jgi:hypothetical protein
LAIACMNTSRTFIARSIATAGSRSILTSPDEASSASQKADN